MDRVRVISVAAAVLLLTLSIVWAANSKVLAPENSVPFMLIVRINTPSGEPESYAKIFIYELSRDGETMLIKSLDVRGGAMTTMLSVEKIKHTPSWWLDEWDPIYVTINLRLWIFGLHGYVAIGLPVDPLEVEREGKLVLNLTERLYLSGKVYDEGVIRDVDPNKSSLEVEETTYEWTHIVTYHSWDSVTAYLKVDYGSKYSEVKKERVSYEFPPGSGQWSIGDWSEIGETVVTIEHGFDSSPTITGQKRMDVRMLFAYKYERWDYWIGSDHYKAEYVFLLDTHSDPYDNSFTSGSPLSGNGVSDPWNYGHCAGTDQGVTGWMFPIYGHGGEKLRFSVSVGFGVQWPPGVSVSVTLTVWKEYQSPAPMFVKYNVGTWYPGYHFYVYDRNTGDMRLYATWAIPD